MRCFTRALLFTVLASGCSDVTGASAIEYRVSGTATRASITYENSSGGTSQTADATLPWSYGRVAQRGDFLYVSAQNSDRSGCVRAEIFKKGVLFESGFSCGAFVIATASGTN